jgi:hypothetical protein
MQPVLASKIIAVLIPVKTLIPVNTNNTVPRALLI